MSFAAFLPDGVAPSAAAIVIVASFLTSALTASFGLGGGLALLAVMTALLPPAAVVPVHGVAQLGSNAARLLLQRAYVVWPIALWFLAGSGLGAGLGARLYVEVPERLLQGLIGAFVLASLWGPPARGFAPGRVAFFATGAASALLAMFVSATGPIAAAMIAVVKLEKVKTVATHAAAMTGQHLLKSLAFGLIGFAFADWAFLIALIIGAGFLGALAGTRLLKKTPEESFTRGFRLVLTFLGCYLIGGAVIR